MGFTEKFGFREQKNKIYRDKWGWGGGRGVLTVF